MQVALLSYNARHGDAIGQNVADKLAFFRERGATVRVFVEDRQGLHPQVEPHATQATTVEPGGEVWDFLAGCDLVLAEYPHHYSLLDSLPLLVGEGPRLLIDYHGVTPPELWGPHRREVLERGVAFRGLLWCADAVLVHSRYMREELQRDIGLPGERLVEVGFPVAAVSTSRGEDRAGVGVRPAECGSLRQELGLDAAQVLLFVGRLAPNKNVPLLVEALHHLRDLQPPVHLVIVGPDRDLYEEQARLCRQRAAELGIAQRVHLLGPLVGERLRQAYAAADVLVTASAWESFCLPVVEAMAAGVPVVGSRCTALPGTIASAGLTFTPGDAIDLARQVRRVLESKRLTPQDMPRGIVPPEAPDWQQRKAIDYKRLAIVTPRHGTGYLCGLSRSLRTIATSLVRANHYVEVFSTCSRSESDWRNDVRAGTIFVEGAMTHLFPIDPWNRDAYQRALGVILHTDGPVSPETEQEFLAHGLHSTALIERLRQRAGEFDAIIIGPYLSSLSVAAARIAPERTLLLPCFHDERFARLQCWQQAYGNVAGLLFHSDAERDLATTSLGFNHPHSVVIGALIHNTDFYSRETLEARLGKEPRSLIYCGRYSADKNLPRLLDWARRYSEERPERFTFVFTGQGEVPIPEEKWAKNLGFVKEYRKREAMARADAFVTLSEKESLSLAALEAWALATPVIASAGCQVLAQHIARSGGGLTVASYDDFARALDSLWEQPGEWRAAGRSGQAYVRTYYYSEAAFLERLETAIAGVRVPLHLHMIRSGLKRACDFTPGTWRDQLSAVVERLLKNGPRPQRQQIEVRRRSARQRVPADLGTTLAAVGISNHGTLPLLPTGPARTLLFAQVVEPRSGEPLSPPQVAPLPRPVVPGDTASAAIPVTVPRSPGNYRVLFWAGRRATDPPVSGVGSMRLEVVAPAELATDSCCSGLLQAAQHDLADASRLQHLPDDYLDVSTGLLRRVKLLLKRKLLGNFKSAYVDVLSRQQSAFNRQVVSVLQHLLECVATLDHALGQRRRRRQQRKRQNQ